MSLIDFIQKLQNKPRYLRVQILWLSVVLVMTIVVSLWVVSLKYSFPEANQKGESELTKSFEEIKQETSSLKEVFKASIGSFFKDDLEIDLEASSLNEKIKDDAPKSIEKIQPTRLPLSN